MAGEDWSIEEVEATVATYLSMLAKELRGEDYNKAAHNRALEQMLNHRSRASIEFKHANISAVLEELHHPWINGYKPRGNYQQLLAEAVVRRISTDTALRDEALRRAEEPAPAHGRLPQPEDPPAPATPPGAVREPKPLERWLRQARIIDYFEREMRNRSLGAAGEEMVVSLERERLEKAGRQRLADRVEQISRSRGDGAGFDVLSFEETGKERFIEVKTTSFAKETPFIVTESEVAFSYDFEDQYYLYRLFAFREGPRLYTLHGSLERTSLLIPQTYRAQPI